MRCWTFGAALAMLVFGSADALDNCDSNVLVKAYEGLNVNAQLVSCMTQNNFSAALDGSVDLTTVNAATAPEQVKSICAADSCKTILSALVGSANFNLTNCIVGNNIVLMTEISNLQGTCTALSTATPAPAATTAAQTAAPTSTTAAPTQAPASTTAAPTPAQTPASTTAAPTTAPAPASTTAAPTPAPAATTAAPTEAPASTTAAPTAAPTEAPATEAPASTTAAPTEAPATEAPATEAPATEAPATEAPASTTAPATEAPASTTATPTTTTAPSLDDPTQQQQQTTFSVLSSDSGSAAGVTPGKYCK
ncbi:hypothetical protein PC116_g17390 [Phytophthora cactorum]|uniref:Elicitin n=1 Tax=Phytophthora cactorum TaxID=29920 RepID=A0A8T1KCN8_9STRA|nr:hypothetical protein PC111_g13088 [Phytophthora cactorum]KAG2816677.1 hypothetical protein PC112_g13358 [Phytophthora cactorum]KAG2853142.1 hypothetical protein PC113_g14417 [Phytophthora cactorum]KAG2926330.1 hypothetical protein PC117_g14925 [Phytophthora cactorum]KAG3005712.1 hypothetical protein PC119_g15202 [Phytophthora cactorum]